MENYGNVKMTKKTLSNHNQKASVYGYFLVTLTSLLLSVLCLNIIDYILSKKFLPISVESYDDPCTLNSFATVMRTNFE